MANTSEYYLELNDEKMFLHTIGQRPTPVRISRETAERIESVIKEFQPDPFSCVKSMTTSWTYCSLVVNIKYNPTTKCVGSNLLTSSARIKTPICCDHICRGKCKDNLMREIIAQRILPEKYQNTQR